MDIIIGIVIGICVTMLLVYMGLKIVVHRAEDDLSNLLTVINRLEKTMIPARVEEHDGVFYVYNTRDDTFMAQGTSITEIKTKIEQRWQDTQVFVTEGDKDVIERLRKTNPQPEIE